MKAENGILWVSMCKGRICLKIAGLQKLTLLDFPGKTACTVFTHGCNLRCPFCHNSALVTGESEEAVTEEEFFSFLRKRQGILDGVAVTGGEPLLQPDIEEFLTKVKALGYSVKLDTNGFFPDRLRTLIEKKLVDYVAMDIKNGLNKYAVTCGRKELDISPVLDSIELLQSGAVPHEFRTTAVNGFHTPEDFESIGRLIEGTENYFIQNFVDSGALIKEGLTGLSKAEMQACLTSVKKYIPTASLRGL